MKKLCTLGTDVCLWPTHGTWVANPPGLGWGLGDMPGRALPPAGFPEATCHGSHGRHSSTYVPENRTVSRATANPSMHST